VADYRALLTDLDAEERALDRIVADLDAKGWDRATPAAGWDVRDTIAHLAVAEDLAVTALVDEAEFAARRAALLEDPGATEAELTERGRQMAPTEVLEWWRGARGRTLEALGTREARERIAWVTGPMSAMSFATSRLMETWAHGQDVADGLGVPSVPTPRLRHVAELGVRTRGYSFSVRDHPSPNTDVHANLDAPDGSFWSWGTSDDDVVRGPARDFCLVVTQRRHPSDTALEVTGDVAQAWIAIAQAFAGPPTDQRPPASR
jgi:uncharacterized protein (TIGR03084 family)